MTKATILQPPALKHDAMMKRRFDVGVSVSGRLERRIIWNLIAHLDRAGFEPCELNDGETLTRFKGGQLDRASKAMELVFNLDEASLRFVKRGASFDDRHGVLLVLGNGIDVISDWNYFADDRDGFNAAMDAFDAEAFA